MSHRHGQGIDPQGWIEIIFGIKLRMYLLPEAIHQSTNEGQGIAKAGQTV